MTESIYAVMELRLYQHGYADDTFTFYAFSSHFTRCLTVSATIEWVFICLQPTLPTVGEGVAVTICSVSVRNWCWGARTAPVSIKNRFYGQSGKYSSSTVLIPLVIMTRLTRDRRFVCSPLSNGQVGPIFWFTALCTLLGLMASAAVSNL